MPKGGYRSGSGRKVIPEDQKVKKVSVSFPPDVIGHLEKQENVSRYVTELIRQDMAKSQGK